MAELPDKSPGEIIDSAHINDIAARSVQRYANAAERSSLIPTPVPGSLSYLEDVGRVEVYDGSLWSMGGGGQLVGYLTGANGVVATPMYSFSESPSSGMYYSPGAGVRISNLGAFQAEFSGGAVRAGAGTIAAPSLSFQSDSDTGMYRQGSNIIGFSAGGLEAGTLTSYSVEFIQCYDTTTGGVANVVVNSTGRLLRSTSARRYKSNIVPLSGDLPLEPVEFHHDGDDKDYFGFIADDMPDERMIIRNDDGEVENYDLRAVVAVLAAKVNALEARVEALEA